MKRLLFLFVLACALFVVPAAAADVPVLLDGAVLPSPGDLENGTTYVRLREFCEALGMRVWWESGAAHAESEALSITAAPGTQYITANGRYLYVPGGVRIENGCTLVPIRALGKAVGAEVFWDREIKGAVARSGSGTLESGDTYYDAETLDLLSRIISAESRGEPLAGQIAVGNVVMNRVVSDRFPNTVYDVIYDTAGGVQFTPVANGQIDLEPAEISVIAAKLVLDGASEAGDSLFFYDPEKSVSTWIAENCTFYRTIGVHWFYTR